MALTRIIARRREIYRFERYLATVGSVILGHGGSKQEL